MKSSDKRYAPMPETTGAITRAVMFEIKNPLPTDGFVKSADYVALAQEHQAILRAIHEGQSPSRYLVDEGAQRIASWEDGCSWPISWDHAQITQMRVIAEKVWRSMFLAWKTETLRRIGEE